MPFAEKKLNRKLSQQDINIIDRAYPDIVSRNKNMIDCAEYIEMYFNEPSYDIKTFNSMTLDIYNKLKQYTDKINYISVDTIKSDIVKFMTENNFQPSEIAKLLRIIITGKDGAPNSYNLIYSIGKDIFIKKFIY